MSIGFQRDEDATTDGYGVQPYGTSPYGGGAPAVLTLPDPQVGSDDPTRTHRRLRAASTHVRDGMVIGERVHAIPKLWRLFWRGRDASFVDSLQPYFEAGRFRMLPDATDDTNFFRVFLLTKEHPSTPVQRGQRYDVDWLLQEIP